SFLGNPKYSSQLATTKAGALLVAPGIPVNGKSAVLLKNPPYGWAKVLEVLDREKSRKPRGIHPTAVVAPSARIGRNVAIGAHTVIEENARIGEGTVLYAQVFVGHDTVIGRDCLVYPKVTFRERVTVGDRCIFQPGVVVGG